MTPEEEQLLSLNAVLETIRRQREQALDAVAHLTAENAVLRQRLEERDERIGQHEDATSSQLER